MDDLFGVFARDNNAPDGDVASLASNMEVEMPDAVDISLRQNSVDHYGDEPPDAVHASNGKSIDQATDKLSSTVFRGETQEESVTRRCLIRQTRKRLGDTKKKMLHGLTKGSQPYIDAMREFKQKAISEALDVIFKGDEKLLPDPVVCGRRWFNGLEWQFFELPMQAKNLTAFGNYMLQFEQDIQLLFRPGHMSKYMKLLDTVAKSSAKFDVDQRPWVLLSGDASIGKSYLIQSTAKMLFEGVEMSSHHDSNLSESDGSNNDYRLRTMEEWNGSNFGDGSNKGANTGSQTGNAFLKNILTNKLVGASRLQKDSDGNWRQVSVVGSKICAGLYATNDPLPGDRTHPLLARMLVVKPESLGADDDMNILNRMSALKSQQLVGQKDAVLQRRKLINWYVFLVEWLIAMNACEQVNMSAQAIYERIVREYMNERNLALEDPKSFKTITELMRTLVVEKAVCSALLSEPMLENRFDAENCRYRKFLDNGVQHVLNIEKFLFVEQPEFVYCMTMCNLLFGDEVQVKIVAAANNAARSRKLVRAYANNTVEGTVVPQLPAVLPAAPAAGANKKNVAEAAAAAGGKQQQKKKKNKKVTHVFMAEKINDVEQENANYVELIPDDGMLGKEAVAKMLQSYMRGGKTSLNNIKTTLGEMQRTDILHHPYTFNGELIEQKDQPKMRFSLLRSEDNGDTKNSGTKAKFSKRYFINTHLLQNFSDPADVLVNALRQLEHHFQRPVMHVCCWPLCEKRWRPGSVEQSLYEKVPMYNFEGVLRTLKMNPRPDYYHKFKNEFCMTAMELQTVTCFSLQSNALSNGLTDLDAQLVQSPIMLVNRDPDEIGMIEHLEACGAPLDFDGITHWAMFSHDCLTFRRNNSSVFKFTLEPYQYPLELLRKKQQQLELRDIETLLNPNESNEDVILLSQAVSSQAPPWRLIERFKDSPADLTLYCKGLTAQQIKTVLEDGDKTLQKKQDRPELFSGTPVQYAAAAAAGIQLSTETIRKRKLTMAVSSGHSTIACIDDTHDERKRKQRKVHLTDCAKKMQSRAAAPIINVRADNNVSSVNVQERKKQKFHDTYD